MKNKIKKFLEKGNICNQDNRKNAGITLVALVITIIVLLILAGITVAQLSKNGLFENAKLAKEKEQAAKDKEDAELINYDNEINSYINGYRDYETEINSLKERMSRLENSTLSEPELIFNETATQLKKYNLIEGKSIANYKYLLIQANDANRANYKQYSNLIPVTDLKFTQTCDLKIAGYGTCGVNMHFDSNTSFVTDDWCGSAFYIQKIYGIK